MLKWWFLFAAVIGLVAGVFIYGFGLGKKSEKNEQLVNQVTLTDKSLVKLNEVDRKYDAILSDIRSQPDDSPCPVAMPIRRAIDLLPDSRTSK